MYMWNGKKKALTFSYDDGVTQDVRLVEIFNKYGLKATFNLNSGLLGQKNQLKRDGVIIDHNKVAPADVKHIYAGHEVAAHTLTHPMLPKLDDGEVLRQVEEDRIALSELVGYEVLGMAYPGGGVNCDGRVAEVIRRGTPIKYARTVATTGSFEPYSDLYQYKGTVYHHAEWDKMAELCESFVSLDSDGPAVLYIWGHSYEFDIFPERWAAFEELCRFLSRRNDIFYGTNLEVLGN